MGYSPGSQRVGQTEQLSLDAHSVYVSMLLSQFVPASPSPAVSTSLFSV